jgi:hypothetical protein
LINIARLVCNVTVKTGEKKSPLSKDAKAQRPDMHYRTAEPHKGGQSPASPSETATEDKGPAAGKSEVSASGADPHKVADRVYELMKQEIRLGRLRGEGLS